MHPLRRILQRFYLNYNNILLLLASSELLVLEHAEIFFVSYLVEIVHVELPHKGGKVAMPEENGEHHCFKLFNVCDGEVGALVIP